MLNIRRLMLTSGRALISFVRRAPRIFGGHTFSTSKKLRNRLTTEELVRLRGYAFETHYAITDDGFISCLHRIPNPGRSPVLFWHGLLMSSEVWVCSPNPKECLPFALADLGYDIWLGNSRGNKYSSRHIRHGRDLDEYWDYSVDTVALYDLPRVVDYILRETRKRKLSYVAFSQGCAQGFAALSMIKALNDKINLFIALAPAAKPKGLASRLATAVIKISPESLYPLLGRKAFLPITEFFRGILPTEAYTRLLSIFLTRLFDWKCKFIHEKNILYQHLYSTASVKQVVHWLQIIRSGKFQMYDERSKADKGKGLPAPSPYPVKDITVPMALFCGGSDILVDVEWLLGVMPEPKFVVEIKEYEHLCFIWADGLSKTIHPFVFKLLDEYSKAEATRFQRIPAELLLNENTREGLKNIERKIPSRVALSVKDFEGEAENYN